MKFYIGTFMNIPLYLHWSWYALILIILLFQGVLAAALLVALTLLVIFHEYGHCAAAKYYSIPVDDIIIYAIGGVANIRFTEKYEVVIAAAGPAVNFVLALIFVICGYIGYIFDMAMVFYLCAIAFWLNVVLCVFNLLPCLPMDGGRIARGFLSKVMNFETATWWAARLSQFLCFCFMVLGIVYAQVLVVFLFLFVFAAAQQELVLARQMACIQAIKNRLADTLQQPELKTADLPQVIAALELVQDDKFRNQYYEELVSVLNAIEGQEQDGLQGLGKRYNTRAQHTEKKSNF